jgi:hypothetical protein
MHSISILIYIYVYDVWHSSSSWKRAWCDPFLAGYKILFKWAVHMPMLCLGFSKNNKYVDYVKSQNPEADLLRLRISPAPAVLCNFPIPLL